MAHRLQRFIDPSRASVLTVHLGLSRHNHVRPHWMVRLCRKLTIYHSDPVDLDDLELDKQLQSIRSSSMSIILSVLIEGGAEDDVNAATEWETLWHKILSVFSNRCVQMQWELRDGALKSLAVLARLVNPRLQSLDLQLHPTLHDALLIIADPQPSTEFTALVSALQRHPMLNKISLAWISPEDEAFFPQGGTELLRVFATIPHLCSLYMEGIEDDEDQIPILLTQLTEFHIRRMEWQDSWASAFSNDLQTLAVEDCIWNLPESFHYLCTTVALSSIRSFKLRTSYDSTEYAETLHHMILHARELRQFCFERSEKHNTGADRMSYAIASSLFRTTSLQHLRLQCYHLESEGYQELEQMMQPQSSYEPSSIIAALVHALNVNKTLETLDLSGSRALQPENLQLFLAQLQSSTIASLNLCLVLETPSNSVLLEQYKWMLQAAIRCPGLVSIVCDEPNHQHDRWALPFAAPLDASQQSIQSQAALLETFLRFNRHRPALQQSKKAAMEVLILFRNELGCLHEALMMNPSIFFAPI